MAETQIPEGYRHTEVGIIPKDWEVKKVCDFTGLITGGTPKTDNDLYWGGEVNWMSSGELNNKRISAVEKKITQEGLDNSSTHIIPIGCVLIGLAGQGKTRGTVAINYIELCTNQSIASITPSNIHIPEYLYQNLHSRYLELRGLSTGGEGRGGLNKSIINSLVIPLPPKIEQKAIAQTLSDSDELIQSIQKLISKKEKIKDGTMQELLTGKKRIEGFSEDWEVKTLGEIGEITGAGVDKKINLKETQVKLLNYLDVYRRDYIYSDELNHWVTTNKNKIIGCNVKEGDIFLTPSSELRIDIGFSAIAMEDMENVVYSYHIDRFRLTTKFDKFFSLYMLKTKSFLSQCETMCEGSGKRYVISMGKFKGMIVKFPKSIEEQKAISQIISDMDSEINSLKQKLNKYQKMKEGMMEQLLTGKIRLIK